MTLFTTIVGIAQIIIAIGVLRSILLDRVKIFNEMRLLWKLLIDKNQSIGSKTHHLKKQILLSSGEIIKTLLVISSVILSLVYLWLAGRKECTFSNIYGLLNCLNMDFIVVSVIFYFYFILLTYVFYYNKKESKKMDEDFVPYSIKIETEKK
jgi:hypothetical protein